MSHRGSASASASAFAPPTAASDALLVPDYARLERRVGVALQHSRCLQARLLPPDLVRLILSFLWSPRTSISRQLDNPRRRALWTTSLDISTGWIHGDTAQYDDWTGELRARVMAGWRLSAIEGFGDRYCNGFRFTYSGPHGELWSTEARKGSHHRPGLTRLQLAAGERVVQVAVRLSKWMECCVFETSAGRRFQVGGRGSRWAPKERHASEWTHAGVTQLLLMPQPQSQPQTSSQSTPQPQMVAQYEALAFTYGVGGHIHNLGVYFQPLWTPQTPSSAPVMPLPASRGTEKSASATAKAATVPSVAAKTTAAAASVSTAASPAATAQSMALSKLVPPSAALVDAGGEQWSDAPHWLSPSTAHTPNTRLPLLTSS